MIEADGSMSDGAGQPIDPLIFYTLKMYREIHRVSALPKYASGAAGFNLSVPCDQLA